MDFSFECPNCKKEIETIGREWNTKTICPVCGTKCIVEYDFYVGENQEEHPCPVIKIATEKEYTDEGMDFFESRVPSF